jgi:hypothetical protein
MESSRPAWLYSHAKKKKKKIKNSTLGLGTNFAFSKIFWEP